MRSTTRWSPERDPTTSWRANLTLSFYRVALAFTLVLILTSNRFDVALASHATQALYLTTSRVYLVLGAGLAGAGLAHWPKLSWNAFTGVLVDVTCLLLLSFASDGASGSLATLILTPLVAAGILLRSEQAWLLAALASLGLIGQELLRSWLIPGASTDFVQSGVLGALYFAAVLVSYSLARRVRLSTASAATHARHARDLAELNQHIINHMQTGALIIDAENYVQTCNQAAYDLLGHTQKSANPEQLYTLPIPLAKALSTWRQTQVTPTIVEVGGQALQPYFTPLGDAEANSTLIFVEDAQRANKQSQQAKLISLGRLTASIAHEIRNPLGAIHHAGQLLSESPRLNDEDHRFVTMIGRHTRRINRIITDILGLARYSPQPSESLEFTSWLAETIIEYRESRNDAPVIVVENRIGEMLIRFNPTQIRRVLFNLWDNSDRHARTKHAPKIRIRIHHDISFGPAIDLIDDGPGIAEDMLDQILEPFFSSSPEGTGLGLYIARELCEANGARLLPLAHSDGACFRIIFQDNRSKDDLPDQSKS